MVTRAILFDFDGVLGQTMEDNFEAWQAVFRGLGAEIDRDEFFQLEGCGMRQMATRLALGHGLSETLVPEIMTAKDDYYSRNNRFQFYPGIEEFISHLSGKDLLLGLVTGCHFKRLSETVPESFLNRFQTVVHGDSGCKNKPDPEPYRRAMADLGVNGAQAVVVENAPFGIRAAKKAGAYCLAIASTLPDRFLSEADEIVPTHEELFRRLGQLVNTA